MLLDLEDFDNNILEPACGVGHISKVLTNRGYNVVSEDLVDRGFGSGNKNFLERESMFKGDIITNPPYKYAKEFIEHALRIIPEGNKVVMFLKIQFLEGKARKELFRKYPPKKIYISSSRIMCAKNGIFNKSESSAVGYAWFIWEKGFKGNPEIDWFN